MNRIRQYLPIVCWAFGAVLVVNTVRMVRINRSLTLQITNFYRSIELPAGARVPPVAGKDVGGQEYTLDTVQETTPALLLVFSPTCPACDENWPQWDALVAVQEKLGGQVVAVDITGRVRNDYLEAHGIDRHVVLTSVSPETALAFKFRFTPQTLVLHQGKMVRGWTGVLRDEDVALAADALAGEAGDALGQAP